MAGTHARSAPGAAGALIVGDAADLLGQLRDYLAHAGVVARATRRLEDAWRRGGAEAIVLFPDDFDAGEVTDGLSRLLTRSPCPRVIVITAGPRLFEPLIECFASRDSIVILPKPVWGWAILDVLRSWQPAPR
jgi:hypothetical protein